MLACLRAFFAQLFIWRNFKGNQQHILLFRTLKTVTLFMALIASAAGFGAVKTFMQLPTILTEAATRHSDNQYVILMGISILLQAVGSQGGMAPLILILTPVLLPEAAPQ